MVQDKFGVLGYPVFWDVQKHDKSFDVIISYTQDIMHQVFLGITAKLADYWFSKKVQNIIKTVYLVSNINTMF